MLDITNKTIHNIVRDIPAAATVLEEANIDYYSSADTLFENACRNADVDPVTISERIERALAITGQPEWKSAKELIDYIIAEHHIFTRLQISRLSVLFERSTEISSSQNIDLFDLKRIFQTLCKDIIIHMDKEEAIFFPYIEDLESGSPNDSSSRSGKFASAPNQSRMLRWEHDETCNMLKKLRKLSTDYLAREGRGSEIQELYNELQRLERDIHQHIHLENNILFPLAMELECSEGA